MKKKLAALTSLIFAMSSLAMAGDVIIPGKATAGPWYEGLASLFERIIAYMN